jgi:plasmid stabilization system protein ParE
MVTKIIWNKSAIRDFDKITEYLHDTYSLQVAQKFADKVYDKIDYIVKYPTIGRHVVKTKTLKIIKCGNYHHIY